MYQVKISVDEKQSIVSFCENDILLYRTGITSPYHITEQDPEVQRRKFKEGRASVPPQHYPTWVEGKIFVGGWFRKLFKQIDEIASYMPFCDQKMEYTIHTPFSNQVGDARYKVTEGFKSEELPECFLMTRAIKCINTPHGRLPLTPAPTARWVINKQFEKTAKNTLLLKGHCSQLHALYFLAKLLKREGFKVCVRPRILTDKYTITVCHDLSTYFVTKEYVWAGLDIYLQNPNAYRNKWYQKWF